MKLLSSRSSMRRGVRWGGAVLAGVLVLSGCAAAAQNNTSSSAAQQPSGTASGGATAPAGDPLQVSIGSYPSSWDQDFVGFDTTALMIFKNTYPYLVDYGVTTVDGSEILDTANILPTWAESFESTDGKTWTLTIREGATFPSGNPLTADDVKWSKDRAFAAAANVAGLYRLIGLTDPSQITVVDERTVQFEQEFASALTEQIQAISLFVYDSELLKSHATEADPWATDWAAQNPIDGGYYTVAEAVSGQQISLVANPAYPADNAAQLPGVDFTVVSDTATAATMLRKGDLDVVLGLSASEVADLEGADGVSILTAPNNTLVSIPMNTATGPLADPLVRQAFAYAVPYDQIISTVYGDQARRPHSPVPLDMPGYSEEGFPYETDAAKAQELLQQAGVDGLEVELAYAAGNTEAEQIAVLVRAALGEIGVTITPLPLDPATLGERRQAKDLDLQIISGAQWVNDVEYLIGTTYSEGAALNYSAYVNPEIAEIVESTRSVTDADERNAAWLQVQQILAEDVPVLPLAQPDFALPVRSDVAGFVQPVDSLIRFNTFTRE